MNELTDRRSCILSGQFDAVDKHHAIREKDAMRWVPEYAHLYGVNLFDIEHFVHTQGVNQNPTAALIYDFVVERLHRSTDVAELRMLALCLLNHMRVGQIQVERLKERRVKDPMWRVRCGK
jgi:hypothetical protein